MADVIVCRGASLPGGCCYEESDNCPGPDPELNWGDSISDTLLTSDVAKRERGRVEIEKSFSNRSKVSLGFRYPLFQQPTTIVNVQHTDMNFNGMLRSVNISISKAGGSLSVGTTMEIEANAGV